jgi:hypothetical protein
MSPLRRIGAVNYYARVLAQFNSTGSRPVGFSKRATGSRLRTELRVVSTTCSPSLRRRHLVGSGIAMADYAAAPRALLAVRNLVPPHYLVDRHCNASSGAPVPRRCPYCW